jgi:hypothetical protein
MVSIFLHKDSSYAWSTSEQLWVSFSEATRFASIHEAREAVVKDNVPMGCYLDPETECDYAVLTVL